MVFQAFTYLAQLPPPSGFGLDIVQTGLLLLPVVIVGLPVAYAVGVVIPAWGVKPFLYVGSAIAVIGFLLLSTSTNPTEVAVYLAAYAVGSSCITVSIQNLLVLSLEKGEMGLGTALNSSFRYIGQSLGAPLSGAILSTIVSTSVVAGRVLTLPTRDAFQYCFYAAAALFVVVGLTAILAREVMGQNSSTEVPGTEFVLGIAQNIEGRPLAQEPGRAYGNQTPAQPPSNRIQLPGNAVGALEGFGAAPGTGLKTSHQFPGTCRNWATGSTGPPRCVSPS